MKVLFVINSSYPSSGTGTNIINKLLFDGGLLNRVTKVAILSGKESYFEKDYEIINDVEINRTTSYTLVPKHELHIISKSNFFKYICAVIEKLIFHISDSIFNTAFFDFFAVQSYYKKLKLLNAKDFDLIISMSGRYYPSIAAAKYCERYNVPYLFYQVDPCSTNQYLPEKSLYQRAKIEKYLYKIAKRIITTDLIERDIKKVFPKELCDKVVSMEFPLVKALNQEKKFQDMNPPRCVFTGSIYAGIRDPQYTIRLFEDLVKHNKAELHFAGMRREELQDSRVVECHGILSIEDAMTLNNNADFLINIGNSVTNQVPSKIFDYISTGKPIINICKTRQCPTLKYIEKYPLAITLFEEEKIFEAQKKELLEFITINRGKTVPAELIEDIYLSCTPKFCGESLWNVISED